MAAYVLNIQRRQPGSLASTGHIPKNVATEAEVNAQLARSPDTISVIMDTATEAQIRGLLHYAQAVSLGTDTSSVETALSAII